METDLLIEEPEKARTVWNLETGAEELLTKLPRAVVGLATLMHRAIEAILKYGCVVGKCNYPERCAGSVS